MLLKPATSVVSSEAEGEEEEEAIEVGVDSKEE